jgi:RHS repeat-associated protein
VTETRLGRFAAIVVSTCFGVALVGVSARANFDPVDSTVTANTGAAVFELPLELPPGPGGLEPPLALSYASGQGDGILGVGWRLHLGEIRCAIRFGTPEDTASCPQYEFDGELLLGPDASGNYHTFVESFARIRVIPAAPGGFAPDDFGWEVTGPDGTSLFFGTTEDSRIRRGSAVDDPIASWRLAEVRDVFGNAISVEYDRSEPGIAYPIRIGYGTRGVELFYEDRPDPLHDFTGGVERLATRRLREIQVTSDGLVHQRLVLGYSAEGDYATHRTRLASVQRFGSDCPAFPGPLAGCSALPAHTFTYTDPSDPEFATPDGSQWLADPDWPSFSAGSLSSETADVNGDGLPDLIVAECTLPDDDWPCTDPAEGRREVYLNTGSRIDPTPDPQWSAALAGLTWDAPLLRVVMPGGGSHAGADVCKAIPASVPSGVFFTRRNLHAQALDLNALEIAMDAECGAEMQTIGVEAHWRVVDLNGDGRADLVASSRVGGVWVKRPPDPSGPHEYVEATASAVFLNEGSGWQRASSLEAGLPTLAAMEISDHYGSIAGNDLFDICALYGWWGGDLLNGFPPSICRQMVHYAVSFVELDGDGRLDILASVPTDHRYLPSYTQPSCSIYDKCVLNPDRTLAWVQRRDATGDYVWVRDPRFDLLDPVTGTPLHHQHLVESLVDVSGAHADGAGSFFPMDDGFTFADLNADGLTDVAWRDPFSASGVPHPLGPSVPQGVLLNTGSGWCASVVGALCADAARLVPDVAIGATPVPGIVDVYDTGGLPALRDYTGDGLPDFYRQVEVGLHRLQLFSPSSDSAPTPWRSDDSGRFDGAMNERFDWDGDGAIDRWEPGGLVGRSQSRLSDLLRSADNGRGGVITFTYATGAAQRDPLLEAEAEAHANGLEPGGAGEVRFTRLPVVESVLVTGPNRAPSTTTYAYARPSWCPTHRSGLGYGLVRQTLPDGSEVDRVFYQSHGRAGRLAERTVRDGGLVLDHATETWELVDPSTVAGAWAGDGASTFGSGEPARVGRLVARSSSFEYGAAPGDASGAITSEFYVYDDVYGHNFVSTVTSSRPTATVETTRVAAPADLGRWLIGLVGQISTEAPARNLLLNETSFTYTAEGRVSTQVRTNARRDDASPLGNPLVVHTDYDVRGNVSRQIDANGNTTEFCYDANPGSHPWCDAPAGAGSVLVATRDPLGRIAHFDPHPVFGTPRATSSDYRDVPGTRMEMDAFGRPTAAYVVPENGDEVRVEETVYGDAAVPPFVEQLVYADASGGEAIRTLSVGDGFGGVWRTVEEVAPAPGGAPRYRGVATWHDATIRTSRATYALACGADAFCTGLTGEIESPAVVTQQDAVGRPLRVTSPDGLAVWRYSRTDSDPVVVEPGLVESVAPPSLDVVLAKNPKGDLARHTRDGDRIVGAGECDNPSQPGLDSLDTVACLNADRTLHGYQGGGGPEVVYDALAVAGTSWNDARHRLRYHFDTLGRVLEVHDPDAGVTLTAYDGTGNPLSTRDARGLQRDYAYDALNRLTSITTPPDEPDVTVTHREGERQASGERVGSDERVFWYDDFGRLRTERVSSADDSLTAIYEYDLLGRTTALRYHGLGAAIRYEYAGAFLERVCRGGSCSDSDAQGYVEDIEYDALGRPAAMVLPGGTRTFSYVEPADPAADTRRLAGDAFLGSGASGGLVSHTYDAHDALGNVLSWSTQSSFPEMTASGAYTYDNRNRLTSWTRDGATEQFGYDPIGNLVVHGGEAQIYLHESKPHAITARLAAGASYAYDASGNVASIETQGGAADRHFRFDSGGRLACIGSAAGQCDQLQVFYDSAGRRVREVAGSTTRRFLGDGLVATEGPNGETVYRIEIFVFGERIASTSFTPPTLALDESILIDGVEVSPWWFAALPLTPGLWLLALGIRGGMLGGIARRPGSAFVSALLVAPLVVPAPALGGGGGYRVVHRWVLSDAIGSGVVVVDSDGEILRHTRFRPFGAVDAERDVSGGGSIPRVFAGHPEQAESGLVSMKARWMDPHSGTFLSVDPVVAGSADPQAHNGYSYARNNPVTLTDPSGACVVCPPSYPPFLIDQPPDFPRGARARHRVDVAGRVFGGRWLFSGRLPPGAGGSAGQPLASQKFDLDGFGNPRKPLPPSLKGSGALSGVALVGAVAALLRGLVELVIGENYGEAWRGFFVPWAEGPTGGFLPGAISKILKGVAELVPRNAFANGMHAWHAGSNAALAKALGLLGAPLILLGGILHETPLDYQSFVTEHRFQGTLNHALDSLTDIGANVFGMGVGYIVPRGTAAIEAAVRFGNYIPGPGEPDPRFGGRGAYTGDPTLAWGQYP